MPTMLPVRPTDVEFIAARLTSVARTGLGRIVIVCGPRGSGRTTLLRAVADQFQRTHPSTPVVAGAVVVGLDGRPYFEPRSSNREHGIAGPVLDSLETAAGLGDTLFPVFGLVARIIRASRAAANLAAYLGTNELRSAPITGVITLLRAAASQGTCVCIIDDSDLAGPLWRDLEVAVAHEVRRAIPLLLVLAVSLDDARGDVTHAGGGDLVESLVRRGLADRLDLQPLAPCEIAAAIGPAAPEVVEDLARVAWGRAAVTAAVWDAWVRSSVVELLPPSGRWEYTAAADEAGLPSAIDIVLAHIAEITRGTAEQELIAIREILACGALEGRVFTAQAVAIALDRDEDYIIDLLDLLVAPTRDGASLLEEGRVIDGSRPLWPYQFRSVWHWLALRRHGLSDADLATTAGKLGDALTSLYGDEVDQVHVRVAELLEIAGRTDEAASWRQRADLGGDRELLLRVRSLVAATTDGWEDWECARGAALLLDATAHHLRVPLAETMRIRETALNLAGRSGDGVLLCRALIARADLYLASRRLDMARSDLVVALNVARDLPFVQGQGKARLRLGVLSNTEGDLDEAEHHLQGALADFRTLGDLGGQFEAYTALGMTANRCALRDGSTRQREAAYVHLERAARLAPELETADADGVHDQLLINLTVMARIDADLERPGLATRRYREGIAHVAVRDTRPAALLSLGLLGRDLGQLPSARSILQRVINDSLRYDSYQDHAQEAREALRGFS